MYIMHACDIIPSQEKKKKENTSKNLLYPNTLSHTSPQNLHYTYLCSKNAIPSIVYVPCLCIQNHNYFYCTIQSSWESSSLRWISFM
jgi:hypothetical protein